MELDRATWQHVIDTNLTGPFLCTKHAARHMKTQGAGKIINISSIYGVIAPSKGLQVAYTVTKRGVIGLTKVNAVELAPLNIQINAIVPGWYFSEMTEELRGTASSSRTTHARRPLGRWAGPHRDMLISRIFCLGLCERRGDCRRRRLYSERRSRTELTPPARAALGGRSPPISPSPRVGTDNRGLPAYRRSHLLSAADHIRPRRLLGSVCPGEGHIDRLCCFRSRKEARAGADSCLRPL
jgi:hypothetical protein